MSRDLELALRIRADVQQALREMRSGRQGMDQYRQSAQQLGRELQTVARVLAGVAGAAGIGALARAQLNAADTAIKTARAWGDSAEDVSTLGFAAEQTGASISSLERAQQAFLRVLPQIRSGTGRAADAVEALGINVFDAEGNVRSFSEILIDAADALSTLEDANTRGQLAQEIFGRGAGDLNELLSRNRDQIEGLQEAARRYGREISTDTAVAAELFNDTMNELRSVAGGAARELLTELLPSMIVIAEEMRNSAAESDGLTSQLGRLTNQGLMRLALGARAALVPLQAMGEAIGALVAMQMRLVRGDFAGVVAIFEELQGRNMFREPLDDLVEFYDNLFNAQERTRSSTDANADADDRAAAAAERRAEIMARFRAMMSDGEDEAAQQIERARDALASLDEQMREQVATFGASDAAILEYRLTLGELAEEVERLGPEGERLRDSILAQANAIEELRQQQQQAIEAQRERERLEQEGLSLGERLRTAQERYNDELERYRMLLDAGVISQETFNRAVEESASRLEDTGDKMSQFAIQGARDMQSAFADFLFDPFDQGLDGMLRGFIDVVRRMLAEAAAARILEALFPSDGGGGGGLASFLGSFFQMHGGGIAGAGGSMALANPLAFVNAPRYHGGGVLGLGPDEVPIIGRRGEEMLTRDDPRHRFNGGGQGDIGVRIVNQIDGQAIADAMNSAAGEKVILNVISNNPGVIKRTIS